MPNYDRTGPDGYGPKTGRGMGKCGAGRQSRGQPRRLSNDEDYTPQMGRGMGPCGRGMGFGRGMRRNYQIPEQPEKISNQAELEAKIKELKETLTNLEEKLENLK